MLLALRGQWSHQRRQHPSPLTSGAGSIVSGSAGSSSVNILVQLCLCHCVSPTLMAADTTVPLFRPLCQQPPQPEAAQAQPNSKQHTMQTADKNRMDTCRCGFALLLGCTLKIKNKSQGSGNTHKNGIPGPDCRVPVKRGG